LFCSQILLARGRPQTRYRRIHSGVRHPPLAEILGVTRPDDRTPGELGPRPTRTVNEESSLALVSKRLSCFHFFLSFALFALCE
jgi:hypothetical protein